MKKVTLELTVEQLVLLNSILHENSTPIEVVNNYDFEHDTLEYLQATVRETVNDLALETAKSK